MPSILDSLRLLSDPLRARIALLLAEEELSVAELQEILAMGQSRISTHLAQLKRAGLADDRRQGKNILYRLRNDDATRSLLALLRAQTGLPEAAADTRALQLALRRRADKTRAYFDELAGKFGRHYVPGRSWKALAETLLLLLPPLDIADLGAGEGSFSQLLSRRAKSVIAVDNSQKMVDFGSDLARRNGLTNLDYRLGDLESLPIPNTSVDLAFLSQALHHATHPTRAIAEAARILRPGGRMVVLDLKKHNFEEAREMYADLWLGFSEVELEALMAGAGFQAVEVTTVYREQQAPYFETVLALGVKLS
ncbi:MAG: metalloregulator ArsR/SmtB family transcription factor [Acidobacteria bacterium]|nr:metalloregulator ArsR/SmtB family transcription factor [Acidobacteriota bacterium]